LIGRSSPGWCAALQMSDLSITGTHEWRRSARLNLRSDRYVGRTQRTEALR